jgi:hypothetical protein
MKRALTQTQAAELLRAASLLPPTTRDAFLAAVDARLCSLPHRLNDGDVQSAIVAVLADTDIRVTTSHFMCDSAEGAQAMAKKKWEIIETATGRVIDTDDPMLRDGQTLRVPMTMRDSMSEMQRSVADHKMARERFGLNDALDLHRPGQRFSTDAAARARVEEARAEGIREMCDAWKNPPVADQRGQRPGDQCTIDGQPGHLNHRLECLPDKRQDSAPPRTMDAIDAQKIKDAAWLQSVQELEQAWRR